MKLSELIKTKEVKIPKTDLVIKIKTELSWFEQLECVKIEDEIERGKYLTCRLIIDWNLEDEHGNPLPITEEVIGRLPSSIAVPISKEITKIARVEILKKNS